MKYLLVLVMLVALPVSADWRQVAKSVSGNVFYVDPATIRKEGNKRKVWGLTNIANPDASGIFSRKQRKEFDCAEERYRALSIIHYSKPMGDGVVLLADDRIGQWLEIAPDTVDEELLKLVCAK